MIRNLAAVLGRTARDATRLPLLGITAWELVMPAPYRDAASRAATCGSW